MAGATPALPAACGRDAHAPRRCVRARRPRSQRLLVGGRDACVPRACYVLSSITGMNRFSHVDLAAPPFPPPRRGGKGGARADHGRALQRPRPSASAGFADRRRTTAAERWASCARALPCDALSLPKRGRCNRPPLSPPRRGGKGGRSAWLRCGASSVMKVREGARRLSRSKRRRPAPRRSHRWDRVDVSY